MARQKLTQPLSPKATKLLDYINKHDFRLPQIDVCRFIRTDVVIEEILKLEMAESDGSKQLTLAGDGKRIVLTCPKCKQTANYKLSDDLRIVRIKKHKK